MKIRKATKKDLKELAELFLEESSKKPYFQGYTLKTARDRVNDMLANGTIYPITINKKIVGFIAIAAEGKKDIYIDEFWINKKSQGKGFGKSLLKFIEDKYKKKGTKTISVMTSKNAGAFKFYKKLKYKVNDKQVILTKKLK